MLRGAPLRRVAATGHGRDTGGVLIDAEAYAELVLQCVDNVPPGHVTTYGSIAEAVGVIAGGGGPRQVAKVMALSGGSVAWWRVVRADGSLPPSHDHRAAHEYRVEATAVRASGRVDLPRAFVAARL